MNEQTQALVFGLIVVLLLAVLIWAVLRHRRTKALQGRFGDEYERAIDRLGARDKAEADLIERQERVAALEIRPLTQEETDRFTSEWHDVKAVFVDSPAEAALHADRLLSTMLKTRGYPMVDFDRRYEDLTVNHPDVARHYREGHDLALRQERGEASTEDLRQAMRHYENLFDELVHDVVVPDSDARAPTVARG